MEIADPRQAELRIELAVGDALDFKQGAEVALFLDSDPLNRHTARLQRSVYEAQQTANGQLAYRLDAEFEEAPPLIGLYGQLFASVGVDPLPRELPSTQLSDIAQALSDSESRWQAGDIQLPQ